MGVILNNLIPIIGSSIAMSIPLVLASVGGAFSVRSGIMALGLESMMMMGAFFGVLGSYFTGSVLFGFLLGMVGGMVIGLFHGILSVRYKVNQVISGIGLNLLALAVTTLLMQLIWSNKGSTPQVASISTTLDFFAPIPVIGHSGQAVRQLPCDGRCGHRGLDCPLQNQLRPAPAHGGREPKGRFTISSITRFK